jgi:hypothetical protein
MRARFSKGPSQTLGLRPGVSRQALLQAAIFFVQARDSCAGALDAALAHAGPANYCPVLVGAIGGARWGAASIEPRHIQHCDVLAQVDQNALALARMWTA